MAIIPIVFMYLGVRNVTHLFHFSMSVFFLLLLGVILGVILGHCHVRKRIIRSDKDKNLIEIPGDISLLIIVMSIFFIEFFIHYAMGANLSIVHLALFKSSVVLLSGLVMGISIGRNTTYFMKYLKSKSTRLEQ